MLQYIKNITSILSFMIVMQSCSYYVSNTTMPTAFKDKNDFSAGATISAQGAFANLAYSPIKHISVNAQGTAARGSTHFSGGIGGYYSIDEEFGIEACVQYGLGNFDWGDPMNGMSEPSQINLAVGNLQQTNSLFSFNFYLKNCDILSLALVHRYLDVSFDRTNYDDPTRGFKVKRNQFQMYGAHLIYRKRLIDQLNLTAKLGYEGTNSEDTYYTYNPVFLRVGLEFRLSK